MIQLKSKSEGYELTDRKKTLILEGSSIKLEDQTFDESGEYEVEGIEVIYGNQAALIAWEKLQIAYIFDPKKPTAFEKSEFTPCNVLVLAKSITSLAKTDFGELLETYDPSIVVACSASASEELKNTYKFEPIDNLKLALASLPEENRELYVLP